MTCTSNDRKSRLISCKGANPERKILHRSRPNEAKTVEVTFGSFLTGLLLSQMKEKPLGGFKSFTLFFKALAILFQSEGAAKSALGLISNKASIKLSSAEWREEEGGRK